MQVLTTFYLPKISKDDDDEEEKYADEIDMPGQKFDSNV